MADNTTAELTQTTITTAGWRAERDPAAGVVWVSRIDSPPPAPEDWRPRMVQALRALGGVQAVGAKRLTPQGRVFAMGEFVIHPKGFHHQGQGVLPHAFRFPEEVDVLAGGMLAVDLAAFEAVDGQAALAVGDLGAVELCLRLRRDGGRCVALPQVVVQDDFTPQPDAPQTRDFLSRWGFDWQAADLDAVRARYPGGGLTWHPRYHAPATPFDKYESRPAVHWHNYANVDVYRQRADHLVKLAARLCPAPSRVLDIGCGDGLFTHLLAQRSLEAVGVDPEATAIEQARQQVQTQAYPATEPTFHVGRGDGLDFENGTFDLAIMLDVIEHLPNPVCVLREAARVLSAKGTLLITTPAWQYGGWSDAFYHVTEYTPDELKRQVEAATDLGVTDVGKIGGVYRDIIIVARRQA